MNCPTCDAQMWNTMPGYQRCPNDHLWRIEELSAPEAKVIRVDQPSRHERIGDALVCFFAGAMTTSIVAVLVERL